MKISYNDRLNLFDINIKGLDFVYNPNTRELKLLLGIFNNTKNKGFSIFKTYISLEDIIKNAETSLFLNELLQFIKKEIKTCVYGSDYIIIYDNIRKWALSDYPISQC